MAEQEIATLGGGCFWCTEAVFLNVKGVLGVQSGYAGGERPNPTYREICTGLTGHAEVVQVTFDPRTISYRTVLEIFFATHDPTTLNRQGADIGTQYRSVIFYHSPEQQQIAAQVIEALTAQAIWPAPIVTQVAAAPTFYPAEEYHSDYYRRNPLQPYCQAVIAPKVATFRKRFADYLNA